MSRTLGFESGTNADVSLDSSFSLMLLAHASMLNYKELVLIVTVSISLWRSYQALSGSMLVQRLGSLRKPRRIAESSYVNRKMRKAYLKKIQSKKVKDKKK
jgi:hypothetical protein